MDFVLWVCRSMHVFGVIVWLGGLMFQSAIAAPVAQAEGEIAKAALRKMSSRFIGFIWMSVWTVAVTGVLMMLLNPQFEWFRYHNTWSKLLGFKQLIFLLMIFYAFGYARMLSYLNTPVSNGGFDEKAVLYRHRLNQFRKISIALGIVALLLAAGM
ncbi:MAG: hypothetical protein EPO24_08990 [Bacteroidetes bacterium]|nr:MAG: hypothetical protein EPO24_08990 [Bacteroidota bacterium]